MALFNDSKVKNVRLRKIPIIVVAILNTDPSAAPLSFGILTRAGITAIP